MGQLTIEVQQLDHTLRVHGFHTQLELLLDLLIRMVVYKTILDCAVTALFNNLHRQAARRSSRPFFLALDENVSA